MPKQLAIEEQAFQRVLSDWLTLMARDSNAVASWEEQLALITAEEQRLRKEGRWVHGRDDLFGILGLQRAEVKHTAMVGWLFDPCARHGLGARVLEGFLARALPGSLFGDLNDARVACEVVRGPCRADIVVRLPEGAVVIEAKVDAAESERQCEVLFEQFGVDPGVRFVFLTPTGAQPTSASGEVLLQYAVASFADVRAALAGALDTTSEKAASVGRATAENYLRTLTTEFP